MNKEELNDEIKTKKQNKINQSKVSEFKGRILKVDFDEGRPKKSYKYNIKTFRTKI